MKTMPIVLLALILILSGCDKGKKSTEVVRLATLQSIEIGSVSLIAEEDGNNKQLLRIPCSARLGIDLDEVKFDDKGMPDKLVVKLPQPSVLSPKVHHKEVALLDERKTIWSSDRVGAELRNRAYSKAQDEVERLAMTEDILKMAKRQTERLIICFYKQAMPNVSVSVEWKND